MAISKFGVSVACAVFTLGFTGIANAGVVGVPADTIKTENDCVVQEGFIVDGANGKVCWAPLIPAEFQTVDYAGSLTGVDSCDEKNIAKTTKAGNYCKIALGGTPAPAQASSLTDAVVDMAKDKAEDVVKDKAKKKLFGN